jgi:hypothetical protein
MNCLHLAPPPFVSFGILHNLNSTDVNGDIFIKYLQGCTFAFEHLFLQISDSNIHYEVFLS